MKGAEKCNSPMLAGLARLVLCSVPSWLVGFSSPLWEPITRARPRGLEAWPLLSCGDGHHPCAYLEDGCGGPRVSGTDLLGVA